MKRCKCNYHLGMGPNTLCPVHGRKEKEDMRKQIGWYNQKTGLFCGCDIKARPHGERFKEYDTPVFTDDETEKEPEVQMKKKKVSLREMMLQALENQVALLLIVMRREHQGSVTHKHLGKMRTRTIEILKREKT